MTWALLLLMGTRPAVACSCVGGPMPTWSPEDGAAGVPTNAQILLELWSDSLPYFAADNLTVVADGVEDPLAFEITTPVDDGDHVVGVIRFQDELPPDARIDLWLDGGEIPLYGFTTGSGPDLAAPTWDGAYSVDQTALGGSCGRTHRFQVDLDGVAVDDADHALVIAESISGGRPVPRDAEGDPLRGSRVVDREEHGHVVASVLVQRLAPRRGAARRSRA